MLTTNPHMKYIIQSPDFHTAEGVADFSSIRDIKVKVFTDF